MKKVIFPLTDGMRGATVADLQAALRVLLDRNVLDIAPGEQEELDGGLRLESASQAYKGATQRMVVLVQERWGLQVENFGEVDGVTAEALNAFLQEMGLVDQGFEGWSRVVEALAVQSETLSAINAGTDYLANIDAQIGALRQPPALTFNMRGAAVADLQAQLGQLGVVLPREESAESIFGSGTRAAILQLQAKYDLSQTGIFDEATRNALTLALSTAANRSRVEGRIFTETGLPAANIKLRIVNRGFGDDVTLLGDSEIETDERGYYALPYDGTAANIEVQAIAQDGTAIKLSNPKVNADRTAILNLVAPAAVQTQANEWQLLARDLTSVVGDMSRLAQAREGADGQDISLLHEATQWDARLIATAATAANVAAETAIAHDVLYGALRTGLPADREALAAVSHEAFASALSQANAAGVIALDEDRMTSALNAFDTFRLKERHEMVVPGALSSMGEMLATATIDTVELEKFAELALQHDGTGTQLWQAAADAGIPEDQISTLQLQGKLAFLTLNNAPLTATLQAEISTQDQLSQLVEKDLYRQDQWVTRLNRMAKEDEDQPEEMTEADLARLAQLIPPAYTQPTVTARRDAYAEDMARMVRQSYPTHVVQRMIGKDELPLGSQHDALKAPVQRFLGQAVEQGFQLGRTPVESFIEQHRESLFAGMEASEQMAAETGAKLLTRVYQMTPSDKAMTALLELGFTSAQQVTALPRREFIDRYWERFGSRQETELVWDKSQQITSMTFNIYSLAKRTDSDPPLLAISGTPQTHADEKEKLNKLLKAYPTVQALFGSQDFCACEHCRSVLSPAAYLVDLLRFVDPPAQDWEHTLKFWQDTHQAAYGDPPYNFLKPYDALIARRPDIPHLPLTCENTNVALPYIDLVNEILEYYVVHQGLDAQAVHDTGEATSAELLAEPHNLIADAYTPLRKANYPLTLPFDLWLETVRRFCDYFETPFWQLLDVFRPNNTLFPPTDDGYTLSAIFAEYLGLTATEYATYTGETDLAKLYGLPPTIPVEDLQSAETLAKRLGISYQELADLIQTEFINPNIDTLITLHKLRVGVSDVLRYRELAAAVALTDEQQLEKAEFEMRLVQATDKYKSQRPDFDAALWLEAAWNDGQFKRVLLLRDDSGGCSFAATQLGYADENAETLLDLLKFDLLKINLFVRLWRRLGWSLAETDRALCLFLPDFRELDATTQGTAMQTALVYLAHLKELTGLLNMGKNGRLKLLTLWGDLPTYGKNSLYAQLFLTRNILKDDPTFDDPFGEYLSNPNLFVIDHLPALQAALTLTSDEIRQILQDAGQTLDNAVLSLANVSLLYRYGLLAKGLKLSIADLITLKTLSGLNPFHPLHPTPLTTIEEDYPLRQTLAFVRLAQQIKASRFKISDLDYWLRHQVDPLDKGQTDVAVMLDWIGRLAVQLHQISADYAIPTLAENLTAEALQQKIALVYAPFAPIFEDAVRVTSVEERLTHLQQILPFLQDKLTRQAIMQAATTQFGADAALLEALQEPLLMPVAALSQRGLSIERTPGEPAIVSDVAVTAADNLTNASWRGYLVVPQDGDYRFFAKLGKQDATIALHLATLSTPLLTETAAQDDAEWEVVLPLKAGVLHPITLVVGNLQGSACALLVKGEKMTAKGALSQFILLPQTTVTDALTAYTLLEKGLRVVQEVGLSAREVGYLLAHAANFTFDLTKLPTVELPAEEATQFTGLLRLLDYAALKRDMAGGGDDLIALFEHAAVDAVEVLAEQVATLTRRKKATVEAVSAELRMTDPAHFTDLDRLTRLWQALQVVERFGLPMATVKKWLTPTPDATIAAAVRNAVKARYEPETWQRIAKAIFDPLRQKQRDALVAYIIHITPELDSLEKLFEYFLIDPGMEPVVQTSRLRLAISSLQTFIQRCFLNLELRVHPSMLNADHWQWMKRYRVWEANRKIFLFPENWLEPEWRDDKTHLYQELESSLLQGDVTNQLAEDALYVYLKKLDQLARLEIVTMYAEERPQSPPILHVIGRTHTLPHQYFYRRYAHQMWTAWEPVSAEIDGQHIVAVVWRERLHLFWLSLMEKVEQGSLPQGQGIADRVELTTRYGLDLLDEWQAGNWDKTHANIRIGSGNRATILRPPSNEKKESLMEMSFDSLVASAGATASAAAKRKLDIQLNWSEYFQGSWTTRESSGFGNVVDSTAPETIFVTVSVAEDGGAVNINLNGLGTPMSFRVLSKNSRPLFKERSDAPPNSPYPSAKGKIYNRHTGAGALSVSFVQQIVTTDGNKVVTPSAPQAIFNKGGYGSYTLLPTSNQMRYPNAEFAPLVSPLFFADDLYTFFVEPSLTETTVDLWQGYTIPQPSQKRKWQDYVVEPPPISVQIPPKYWQEAFKLPDHLVQPEPIDPLARHGFKPNRDALTQVDRAVLFDGNLIGATGVIAQSAALNRTGQQ